MVHLSPALSNPTLPNSVPGPARRLTSAVPDPVIGIAVGGDVGAGVLVGVFVGVPVGVDVGEGVQVGIGV